MGRGQVGGEEGYGREVGMRLKAIRQGRCAGSPGRRGRERGRSPARERGRSPGRWGSDRASGRQGTGKEPGRGVPAQREPGADVTWAAVRARPEAAVRGGGGGRHTHTELLFLEDACAFMPEELAALLLAVRMTSPSHCLHCTALQSRTVMSFSN